MKPCRKEPRILVVTPELSFLPGSMGPRSQKVSARAGGLGDVASALVQSLMELGADVHVAFPNYRRIFRANPGPVLEGASGRLAFEIPHDRVHLVQDRSFFYLPRLFIDNRWENIRIALALQREVINRVLPLVQPDLIHCHGWMTGLIPAMAREYGIPCLFTLYNLDTVHLTLGAVEEQGIDAAEFWQKCFYSRMPASYEETRDANPLDMLASAVFAAHFVNTLSPAFSKQIVDDACDFIDPALRRELQNKVRAGCLASIEHAPPSHFEPSADKALCRRYGAQDHAAAKAANKIHLQEILNLQADARAPLFFWPTRLDRSRLGCSLMTEILPELLARYDHQGLQVVFVADGDMQHHFRAMVERLGAGNQVAVCGFGQRLYRQAFAASDFVLIPVQVEPCGLACKIGLLYGALPIGYDTGGVHDTLVALDIAADRGNGFVFRDFDPGALSWAIDRAMDFYGQSGNVRAAQIARIMSESRRRFDDCATAQHYIELYEKMLDRPFGGLHRFAAGIEDSRSKEAA